ncbi:hypothetical protein [Enterococcus sp. AD013-P3]|uniref:hypothetical protein n=1 Tax=Enterococcus sp. AD013-P3 TaxID=3411036 RepID=UPI003B948178
MKKITLNKIITSGAVAMVLATPAVSMAETVDGVLNTDQTVEVSAVADDDVVEVENSEVVANEPTTIEAVADEVVEANEPNSEVVENSDAPALEVEVPEELPVVEDATVEAETLEADVPVEVPEVVAPDAPVEEPQVADNSKELPDTGSGAVVENEAPAPATFETTGWVLIDENTYQITVSNGIFKYNFLDVPWSSWQNYSILVEGQGSYGIMHYPESTEPDQWGITPGPVGNATIVRPDDPYYSDNNNYSELDDFTFYLKEGQTLTLTVKNLDAEEVVDPEPTEPTEPEQPSEPEQPVEPETPEVPTIEEPKDTDTSGESEAPVVNDAKDTTGKDGTDANTGFGGIDASIKDKATPKKEAPTVEKNETEAVKATEEKANDVPKTGATFIGGISSVIASMVAVIGLFIKRRG